eukprot:1183965-Prorocentrum_minimum.AAC.1
MLQSQTRGEFPLTRRASGGAGGGTAGCRRAPRALAQHVAGVRPEEQRHAPQPKVALPVAGAVGGVDLRVGVEVANPLRAAAWGPPGQRSDAPRSLLTDRRSPQSARRAQSSDPRARRSDARCATLELVRRTSPCTRESRVSLSSVSLSLSSLSYLSRLYRLSSRIDRLSLSLPLSRLSLSCLEAR